MCYNIMMKLLISIFFALSCITVSNGDGLKCTMKPADIDPSKWIDMVDPCIKYLENQVKTEIDAAMTYLSMGAHFSRDTINRPGFSQFFFKAAGEEREHAIKVIEYLLMRGQLTNDVSKLLNFPLRTGREEWSSGVEALTEALYLEANVTKSIQTVIRVCEHSKSPTGNVVNDYHLVDYLTGDFLDEQYKGKRDLAGRVSTLGKMMSTHGPLGEFLYDKKLLSEL